MQKNLKQIQTNLIPSPSPKKYPYNVFWKSQKNGKDGSILLDFLLSMFIAVDMNNDTNYIFFEQILSLLPPIKYTCIVRIWKSSQSTRQKLDQNDRSRDFQLPK